MNNILETQVSDLNYLAESPIALSGRVEMNGHRQTSSVVESPVDSGGPKKRKTDDTNGAETMHTRAKRNRYISIACNECKRRKIKCNGNTPCQRCGNLNLECQYAPNCCTNGFKDSDDFRQMNAQLSSLQEQVDNLYANLNALRSGGDAMAFVAPSERSMSMSQPPGATPISPHHTHRTSTKHTSFRGPTSAAFNLDVGKNTLHKMGYQGLTDTADDGLTTQDMTPIGSPGGRQQPPLPNGNGSPGRDPLFALDREEMVRLCRVYEEEMGIMYPVISIEQVIMHGRNIFDYIDAVLRSGPTNSASATQGINDEQSSILKMILACATLTEGNGQSSIGNRLFESVRHAADRIMHAEVFEVKNLPVLVLVAIYHFHCDEEALAWRIIGLVGRMCIELGLHRRESLFKVVADEEERASVVRLFWSIYVLDRRWSFGTGLPFALQDADIDSNLPDPEMSPYLNVMIAYSRIGSRVWRSVCSFSPSTNPSLNIDEIGYLDYQILQWQKTIPPELQLPTASAPKSPTRAIHRLQILLYVRSNQMRILIYSPVLYSASSIQENLHYATTVVELAKDTIRALTHLNQTSDIYRKQQVCFNYFLVSALAVIFLASCHAPVHFSSLCRDEYYMALDLVKGFSNKSWVSKRLWRTIKGLKEVGPKLGLSPDVIGNGNNGGNMGPEDPHSSAALAMAGLAGHEISGLGNAFAQDNSNCVNGIAGGGTVNTPMNGFQMSYEMTNLFEAALGSVSWKDGANAGYVGLSAQEGGDNIPGVGSNVFGGDEELYRQMRDLF